MDFNTAAVITIVSLLLFAAFTMWMTDRINRR